MGLEDLAMFSTVPGATVLYPGDAVATEKLVEAMTHQPSICYLRTTRGKTPVIYDRDERFAVGECKVIRESETETSERLWPLESPCTKRFQPMRCQLLRRRLNHTG